MLLLHQAGSVKIGEVVRYTVTYTPAHDRIIPSPAALHLKIKNTSAIPLRAAFVHGPYTLYAAAYPATFRPNEKTENPRRDGVPEFEPNLKAGGTFTTQLSVPEDVRQTAGTSDRFRPGHEHTDVKSVTWIIEVTSQVIFSASAVVHYEVLLGRDGQSLQMGFASSFSGSSGGTNPAPGQISDHQQSQGAKDGTHPAQPKGVYSRAIRVKVDDTASLWNTPRLPQWDDPMIPPESKTILDSSGEKVVESDKEDGVHRKKRQKKIHLVVLTHGLHSNLGADMLYLKESIDAAAKQARIDARARKQRERNKSPTANEEELKDKEGVNPPPVTSDEYSESGDWVDEEVIVRGFSGNAVKTERGIKYLGKRLAKYVLSMTYPDQPYKPVSKKTAATLAQALKTDQSKAGAKSGFPTHNGSTIIQAPVEDTKLAYKYTKISFIGHSLGGLIQMYAVAYIQKHSPKFFDIIEPINFIAMASPFLGLSNENPLYVKFALDFGLVGRTGQDLGLTWRAPTLARSGWGAIVGNIGESAHKKIDGESTPEAKPLLRILPTGPAHIVLKKFRNRTVYSNVVNDGIVPLRTSCLLFLDWSGLDRVEKARRENGLVGTMAGWGWAEITGANSSSPRKIYSAETSDTEEAALNTPILEGHGGDVPQPSPYATRDDDSHSLKSIGEASAIVRTGVGKSPTTNDNPFSNFMKLFQPSPSTKPQENHPKHTKIYKRSQTLKIGTGSGSDISSTNTSTQETSSKSRGKATALEDGEDSTQMSAPPKTTFFEAAGDLLKPPLPSEEFIMDPKNRPRTIFHDRVYHPEDIPPPPFKKRPTPPALLKKRPTSGPRGMASDTSLPSIPHTDSNMSSMDYDDRRNHPGRDPLDVVDSSAMKVEEKIARAYHRDLSWRKVLVRLEPDAHNNMVVRRMFANAYGWPVIKHLCDTHFADSEEANTRDDEEGRQENAKEADEQVGVHGEETLPKPPLLNREGRTDSESREATDKVHELSPNPAPPASLGTALGLGNAGRSLSIDRPMSETWSESHWADSADDSDDVCETPAGKGPSAEKKSGWNWTEAIVGKGANVSPPGTDKAEIDAFFAKKGTNMDADKSDLLGYKAASIAPGLDTLPVDEEERSGKVGK